MPPQQFPVGTRIDPQGNAIFPAGTKIGPDGSIVTGETTPTQTGQPPRSTAQNLGTGILKGIASTAIGGAELVNKGMSAIGLSDPIKPEVFEAARGKFATPEGTAQNIGFGVEQIGEFLIPFGGAARAVAAVPKAGRAIRGLARAGGEAAEFAGKSAVQSGGDAEDVVAAAMLGAAAPPLTAAFKTAGKAFTRVLPEKLYGQVFKMADDDLRLAYETQARGKPLNPTLAREVIDRGLMGSSRNMAIYSVKKLDALESQVQSLVSKAQPMALPRKADIINVLKGIEKDFGKGFFTDRAKEAGALAASMKRLPKDFVKTEDALKVRRFLDRMRNTSSFRLDPKLTAKQEELKSAADLIRRTLRENPKIAELMNEERVFIQAFDHIIEDAVRRGNRNIVTLTDVLLGGGGLASGFPGPGLGAMAAARALQQPFSLTGIGQAFHRLGVALPEGTARGTAKTITATGASAVSGR